MGANSMGANLVKHMQSNDSASNMSTIKKYMKSTGLHKTHTFNYRDAALKSKGFDYASRGAAHLLHSSGSPSFFP